MMSETKDKWVDGDMVRVTTKTGDVGVGFGYVPRIHHKILVGCVTLSLKKPAILLKQKQHGTGCFIDKAIRVIIPDGYVYLDGDITCIEVLQPRGAQ